jgi:hypothetical protein
MGDWNAIGAAAAYVNKHAERGAYPFAGTKKKICDVSKVLRKFQKLPGL